MNATEAARVYWANLDEVEAHKPTLRAFESAADVIKKHMAEKKLSTFQGIHMREVDGGKRLDQGKVVAKFGDKVADCFVATIRRSLIPVKRPKSHAPAA